MLVDDDERPCRPRRGKRCERCGRYCCVKQLPAPLNKQARPRRNKARLAENKEQ